MNPSADGRDPAALPSSRASDLLGPGGPFAASAEYELRREQTVMADAVSRALEGATVLLCEAGTGVGKTLAYLVPALLSGQRVVISTATKALQDQIVSRDLPAAMKALGVSPRVAIAKGLSNYVCLRRLKELRALIEPPADVRRALPLVGRWVTETERGDISELSSLAEDDPIWAEITSSSDTRVGAGCPHFDACFVTRMRQELARADIVVVNHHLFFADIALKAKAGPGGEARASVLPPYDAVVFDEAHRIEDVMSAFFGVRISSAKLAALLRDATRAFGASLDPATLERAHSLIEGARDAGRGFFDRIARLVPGSEARARFTRDALGRDDHAAHQRLDDLLDVLESFAESHAVNESLEVVRRRARAFRDDAAAIMDPATHHVAWAEARRDVVAMGASAIEVGPQFRDLVVGKLGGVVLTSATLATVPLRSHPSPSPFSFLRNRLGLDESLAVPVEEVELGSPFDFEARALLYVPRDLPDVSHAEFFDHAGARAAELVEIVGGGAFVLTTSARAMRVLGPAIARATGRTVLVQGDAPKSALLERFRAHGNAVLVATMSYWEGVDVPGDALRLVIVDKLPFAVPTDALVSARCEALERAGLDPFGAYSVPEAAITLKQGIGRLLRTRRDRGVAAVLDHRLVSRAYGSRILERLPIARRTESLEDVRSFWERLVAADAARAT